MSAIKCRLSGSTVRLISYGIEYITAQDSKEDIQKKIKSLLSRSTINPRKLWVTLPLEDTLIKEITIPPMDPKLVSQVLHYDIEQHIPYNLQDIAYGHAILDIKDTEKMHLLLGIVKKDIYDKHYSQLTEMGIKQPYLSLKATSLSNYYIDNHSTFKKETIFLLDLSVEDSFIINIIAKGVLRFSKTVIQKFPQNVPFNDPSTESHWSQIFEEIENSITYFQTIQSGSRPSHIRVHNIKEVPDQILDHLCKYSQMQNLSVDYQIEKEYTVPFGLASSLLKNLPNIAIQSSENIKSKKNCYREYYLWAGLGIILILFSFLIKPTFASYKLKPILQQIREHKQEGKLTKHIQKKILTLSQNLENLNTRDIDPTTYLKLFQELKTLLPIQTHMLHLSIKHPGQITLQGLALNLPHIKQTLEISPHLKSISISDWPIPQNPYPNHIGFEAQFFFSYKEGEKRGQN
jgi:hypothetical protein